MSNSAEVAGVDSSWVKPRPKRGRYAMHACNECKRRKVKCDGRCPCERCIVQQARCLYHHRKAGEIEQDRRAPGDRSHQAGQSQSRAEDLSHLIPSVATGAAASTPGRTAADINECAAFDRQLPSHRIIGTPGKQSAWHGPTSADFTLNVLQGRFEAAGFDIASISESAQLLRDREEGPLIAGYSNKRLSPNLRNVLQDTMWMVSQAEVVRLINIFFNALGAIYPILDFHCLVSEAEAIYAAVDSLHGAETGRKIPNAAETVLAYDTTTLKLITAVALLIDTKDANPRAVRLFESVKSDLAESYWHEPDLQNVIHFILAALYYFHLDEEARAGRCVWMAIRGCVELGLDQRETPLHRYRDPQESAQAMTIFRCAVILDRRSSIAVGIPYILNVPENDGTLDDPQLQNPSLGQQTNDSSTGCQTSPISLQYLIAMGDFNRFASEAARIVNKMSDKHLDFPKGKVEYLDYQIHSWQETLPTALMLSWQNSQDLTSRELAEPRLLFVQIVLKIRTYQLRNLLFRPLFYFPSRISNNLRLAKTAIKVAKESISFLWAVNTSTSIFRANPVFFKHFLMSSFGMLVLAMANAWQELGHQVSNEFWQALDLFKVLGAESPIVMRYLTLINGLEALAYKIGLPPRDTFAKQRQPHDTSTSWSFQPPQDLANSRPHTLSDNQLDMNITPQDTADVRAEFINFFDPGPGLPTDLFDFPFSNIFTANPLE